MSRLFDPQGARQATDEEILRSAVFVTPIDQNMPKQLRSQSPGSAHQFYCVCWTNGFAAILYGNPTDRSEWNNLLLKTYRQAERGRLGPLQPEGL